MFEQLFSPGISVSLEPPTIKNYKYYTSLLGFKDDEYILLDFPSIVSRSCPLDDHEPCIIRFVSEGKAYTSRTFILKVMRYPFSLLFIKYPRFIEQTPSEDFHL